MYAVCIATAGGLSRHTAVDNPGRTRILKRKPDGSPPFAVFVFTCLSVPMPLLGVALWGVNMGDVARC